MEALDTARERAQFVGKSLITLPDQVKYVGAGAGIKAITGGDSVAIDPKHCKPFSLVLNAVIIATNNEPMTFSEHQGGIARRRVIFPFNNTVSDTKKDPLLGEKIKSELPVIVRCLLSEFDNPNTAKQLLIAQRDSAEALLVKNTSDPRYGFCSHLTALDEAMGMFMGNNRDRGLRDARNCIYHAYLEYLEAFGHKHPATLTTFGKNFPSIMREFGIEIKKAKRKKGIQYNVYLSDTAEEWLQNINIEL